MKFFVIGDEDTVVGFRLVGVGGVACSTAEEATHALQAALKNKEIGVILITEEIASQMRDEVEARLYGMGFPLVLEIPDRRGPSPQRLRIEDVVRRAIGIAI